MKNSGLDSLLKKPIKEKPQPKKVDKKKKLNKKEMELLLKRMQP